jgi:GNAT superfamily N-acetyltransferase
MDIRQATPADAARLSSLCLDVQRLHAQHHPEIFKMPESETFAVAFFDEILAQPESRIFIAEEDGREVGYIFFQLIERPENPFTFARRLLHIDQISVRPEAQGRGVGAALMGQAQAVASEWHVERTQLDSWDFNTSAHQFFEHLGFQKYMFRFWRAL